MKDTERLKENLKEIIETVKDNIWKYENSWIEEHKEDYYNTNTTKEEKRMIESIFQDIIKGTQKKLKKVDEIEEFFEDWLNA